VYKQPRFPEFLDSQAAELTAGIRGPDPDIHAIDDSRVAA
jgi:hypothetical protein